MPGGNDPAASGRFRAFLGKEFSGWRPGEVCWLAFCLLSIVSLSLYWRDSFPGIVAAASGVMYTVLAGKGKVSCYLFGLVNAPLYAWLSWRQAYYGDMALNLYYFAMMFPGLWFWSRNLSADPASGIVKSRLPPRERAVWAAVIAISSLALWAVLSAFGGSRPLCDAFTDVLSVAAMLLTVKRCIEQWMLWIAVDAIEIFMWWGVYRAGGEGISVLLMWLLFLANGVYLFRLWLKDRPPRPGRTPDILEISQTRIRM